MRMGCHLTKIMGISNENVLHEAIPLGFPVSFSVVARWQHQALAVAIVLSKIPYVLETYVIYLYIIFNVLKFFIF